MFSKILIANRGEIALRVLKACKEMGIGTVAIYSEADKDLKHVKMADEAVCIGPPESSKSYLNIPAIISACELTNAEAIHPGVGFLAENDHFAEQVVASGYTFIGPDPESIRIMGNKISAKEMAVDAGLQCVPGSGRVSATNRETLSEAKEIGYPIMIKAAAGGGGRGISIVYEEDDLIPKMKLTQQEALNSFGSDEIYLEKFLDSPRHIEVQVLADNFGNALHFYERDCSIQRKNQKIVEEAPALNIPEEKKQELFRLCTECCKKMKYKGAGTFEFLYKDEEFYFIEMNTRLQVEHTVSEMITDYDLVKLQIGIAAGEELEIKQEEISVRGHAIQCRINAEHPKTFIPSPGKITEWGKPGGIGVRVDSHVYDGCVISPYYDALIAKICTQGKDREEALCRMSFALEEFFVEGIDTNKELQEIILSEENFRKANISINYLEKVLDIN